jgi:hypothetical protein
MASMVVVMDLCCHLSSSCSSSTSSNTQSETPSPSSLCFGHSYHESCTVARVRLITSGVFPIKPVTAFAASHHAAVSHRVPH